MVEKDFTVFFMHLLDPPCISARANDIVVEFIPERQGREARAGKMGDWREVETINSAIDDIHEEQPRSKN